MIIVIWILIILLVLNAAGFIIRRLISGGVRQLTTHYRQNNTGQAAIESPALKEDEIKLKLKELNFWAKVPVICIVFAIVYLFGGAFLALATGNTEITLTHIIVTAIVLGVLFALMLAAVSKRLYLKSIISPSLTLPILKEAFEVITYKSGSHLSREIIDESGLFNFYDRITGSDYAEGKYRGVHFLLSDVHLERMESDSDGKKSYHTIFKGQWLVYDLDRDLGVTLRLKEQNKKRLFGANESESGMSRILTENNAFNEKFNIMTDDEHSAFYLLTPHFMEYLVSLDERADAQTFFCFTGNRLHIALHSWRDAFEMDKGKSRELESLRQKFRNELKCLTDIIDILLNNDKLFKEGLHGLDLSAGPAN